MNSFQLKPERIRILNVQQNFFLWLEEEVAAIKIKFTNYRREKMLQMWRRLTLWPKNTPQNFRIKQTEANSQCRQFSNTKGIVFGFKKTG